MTARKPEPINLNDVGGIFTTDGKDAWRLTNVLAGPLIKMTALGAGEDGIQGPPSDFANFLRLVPEVAPKRPYIRRKTGGDNHEDVSQVPPEG
jgi:hypothetical protein